MSARALILVALVLAGVACDVVAGGLVERAGLIVVGLACGLWVGGWTDRHPRLSPGERVRETVRY